MESAALFFSLAKLLGGLGLFIYGMNLMNAELQKAAGSKLRSMLYQLTKTRLSGAMIGTLLGGLIHSGATTVMVVGFVNAGLMDLGRSMSIMLGANIGTTLSMQMISFNISKFAFLLIFLGFLIHIVIRRDALKHLGLTLFGFGLLFLGMETMSESVQPLKDAGYFAALLQHVNASTVWGMLSGFLISTVFTSVTQSSGATIGILFALSTAGIFTDFGQIFPLVLGAHVGTCVTTLIGSIGTEITAKRSAVAHLLFNLLGGIVAMVMYKFYAWLVPLTADSLVRQVANLHTLVQVINAGALLAFTPQYTKFVIAVTPSKAKEPEKSHLDESLQITPEKAIEASFLELKRMAAVARGMFQMAMRGFLMLNPEKFQSVRKSEEVVDALKQAINHYLLTLAERDLSRRQALMIQYLTTATNDLERIGDHVENIAELTTDKMNRKIWFDDASVMDLIELYKKVDGILALLIESLEPVFYTSPSKIASLILERRNEYVALSQQIKQKHRSMVFEKKEGALHSIYFFKYIVCFDKLVKHSKTIALVEKEPLFFLKKLKLNKQRICLEL